MAKYNVDFACGHSGEVNLLGKTKERHRKIEWLEQNGECSACYAEQKAKERAIALEKSIAKNPDLPELQGTKKQINWAIVLRANLLDRLAKMDENNGQLFADPRKSGIAAELQGIKEEAIAACKLETDAVFFIESRHCSEASMIRELVPTAQERINAVLEQLKAIELEDRQPEIDALNQQLQELDQVIAEEQAKLEAKEKIHQARFEELQQIADSWTDEVVKAWSSETKENWIARDEILNIYCEHVDKINEAQSSKSIVLHRLEKLRNV